MGALCNPHRLVSAAFAVLFFATVLGSGETAMMALISKQEVRHPEQEYREQQAVVVPRRRLGGPGSSPPSCRARCGRCFPCRPVHVAIQPGRSVQMEYYPEAWRCKCGNKLFMP